MKNNYVLIPVIFISSIIGFALYGIVYKCLLSNSIFCSTEEIWAVIHNLCQEVSESKPLFIFGNQQEEVDVNHLCSIICDLKVNLSCHLYHLNKPIVFTLDFYIKNRQNKLVVKSVIEEEEEEDAYWNQESKSPYIPSEEELYAMVNRQVSSFLGRNLDGSLNEIQSHLFSSRVTDLQIHKEFWKFIYDHEFLTSYLFQDFRVFPKLVGTCHNMYAVEYAEPFFYNPLLPIKVPLDVRFTKAIQLVSLMARLTNMWFEEIHLCDMKHDHFGWTSDGELLFLDLDCVVTESSLKNIMLSIPDCTTDNDCAFFDCHGRCLLTKRCSGERVNTNLQVLCHKIFLGNSDSSIFRFSGLLVNLEVSDRLEEVLELCTADSSMAVDILLDVLQHEPNYVRNSHFDL